MGGGPGCIGAFAASVIGGIIGVLTLGLDGMSIVLIVVGMWWTSTVASVLAGAVFKGDLSALSEGVGAFMSVVPWVGLWLLADRASRDTAFTALAIADVLAVLGFAAALVWAFLLARGK